MTDAPDPQRPLDGIRVLSLAEQYPGPFATMILADMGADVVLVERPDGGDPTRRFPGHFAALNRNKRSIALDLKSPDGLAAMLALVDTADVLVEGFRPGVMEKLGLGETDMRRRNPSLVYCSISGYGQTGPLARRGGHDLSMQAMTGFVTTDVGGSGADSLPRPAPLPLADLASAMFAVVGVLSGLVGRCRGDGNGVGVDVSMVDSLVAWRSVSLVSALNGLEPSPYPPHDPGYGVFRTADGAHVCVSIAGEDHQWRALCEELGLDDLAALSTPQRESDESGIRARLSEAIRDADWDRLSTALEERGVGFGEVNDDEAVTAEPHIKARDMVIEVADGTGLVATRQPVVFDGVTGRIDRGVPALGQHNHELLDEIGMTNEGTRG